MVLQLEAELWRSGVRKTGQVYESSSFYTPMRLRIESPSRVIITSRNWFHCRDELIRSTHQVLRQLYNNNHNVSMDGRAHAPIYFEHDTDGETPPKVVEQLSYLIMGDTNKDLSPFVSPLTLRWLVGKIRSFMLASNNAKWPEKLVSLENEMDLKEIRKAVSPRDRLYRVMRKADERGIRLHEDVFRNWDVKKSSYYAMLGVNQMFNNIQYESVYNKHDWYDIFPPASIVKELYS